MIVPFAIEAEALRLAEGDSWVPHRRLLALWRHLGALVPDATPGGAQALIEAIEGLPQGLRSSWQRAWRQQRIWRGGEPRCWVSNRPHAKPNAWPLAEVDWAEPFRVAALLAQRGVERNTHVGAVWQERLGPLLQGAAHVVVVDRYGVMGMVKARLPNAYRSREDSGLENFLLKASRIPGTRSLELLAQHDPSLDAWPHLDAVVGAALRTGAWAAVEVALAPKLAFIHDGHDRHLRADHLAWHLGRGLDLLAGERVALSSDAVLVASPEFARLREQRLKQGARQIRQVRRWTPTPSGRLPAQESFLDGW